MKKSINQLDILLFSAAVFISLPISYSGILGAIIVVISYQLRPNLKKWMNALWVMFIPILIGVMLTELIVSILFEPKLFFKYLGNTVFTAIISSIFLTAGIYFLFWLIQNRKHIISKIKN